MALYGIESTEEDTSEYKLTENEIYWMQRRFESPPDSKAPSLLSYIYIKDENSIQMSKISEGGFADIFTAKIKYWELSS